MKYSNIALSNNSSTSMTGGAKRSYKAPSSKLIIACPGHILVGSDDDGYNKTEGEGDAFGEW